jgi:hypothetical protein
MLRCLPLACVLTTAVAQQRIEFRTEAYPLEDLVPVEIGKERWLAQRVVDAVTGAPIAGAQLFLVPENETPLPGRFWSVRSATSDKDGFVRVRLDDLAARWGWIVVRAPGHAPMANLPAHLGEVWRLPRAVDIPLLVRDWRGEPVAGARLGFCCGCGHSPDLANATTDARGFAMLPGIDATDEIRDLYVLDPRTDIGYHEISWHPGDPPVLFDCGPGEAITGTLVDDSGVPIAGAFVGTRDLHRGPWTMTAADGSFTLLGGGLDSRLFAEWSGRKLEFDRPGHFPAVLRAPAPDGTEEQQGRVEPPPRERELPPVRRVRVQIDNAGDDPPAASVSVPFSITQSKYERYPADPEDQFAVPASGPFCFVLRCRGEARYFPFADASHLPPEPVALRWFKPTRIIAKVVDPDGKRAQVRTSLSSWNRRRSLSSDDDAGPISDGAVALTTDETGTCLLELAPVRSDLRRRVLWLHLPHLGDDICVDLGSLHLSTTPQLRVLASDGKPLAAGSAGFQRSNLGIDGEPDCWPLTEDGAWTGPELAAGDAVVLRSGDGDPLPFRKVLAGAGPWTVQLPATELDLDVRDEQGPVEVGLFLDADWTSFHGTRRLLHLPAGEHRLFFTAPGHVTAIATVTVPDSGRVDLRVDLPRR